MHTGGTRAFPCTGCEIRLDRATGRILVEAVGDNTVLEDVRLGDSIVSFGSVSFLPSALQAGDASHGALCEVFLFVAQVQVSEGPEEALVELTRRCVPACSCVLANTNRCHGFNCE